VSIQGGAIEFPKTYESNFIHHNVVHFGKQHSRHKAILPLIVLSQQCYNVNFIFLTVAKLFLRLVDQFLLQSPPPHNFTGWICPCNHL